MVGEVPRNSRKVWVVLGMLAYAAVLIFFIARSVSGAVTQPANSDWVAFAVGSRLLHAGSCLYCTGAQIAATHAMGLSPGDGINPFVSLPPIAFVFQPLGLLPPTQGISATLTVCGVLCGISVALTAILMPRQWTPMRRVFGALVSAGSLVGLVAFLQWQWVMLIVLLSAYVLQRRSSAFVCGVVLSFLLVEPQVVWLALPMLLAARQWRTLLGFAAGAVAWIGASVALVGPGELARWPGFVVDSHLNDAFRGVGLPATAAAMFNSGTAAVWTSAMLGVACCALAYAMRHQLRAFPEHALALGVVLSLVAAPHVYAQDLTLLTLTVVLIAGRRGGAALLVMLTLSVVTAIGFLEAPTVLRLLPEAELILAALVIGDLQSLLDLRRTTAAILPSTAAHRLAVPIG
jgi:Glycosyltransferase family 87